MKRLHVFVERVASLPACLVSLIVGVTFEIGRAFWGRRIARGRSAQIRLVAALFLAAVAINFQSPTSGVPVLSQADEPIQVKDEDRPPKLNQPTDACASNATPGPAPDRSSIAPFDPIAPLPEVSAPVGPAGGTLTAKDGSVEISVPAGAVAEDAILTYAGEPVEAARQAYAVYQFRVTLTRQKDGSSLDSFRLPANYSLQVPQNAADAFGSQFSNLALLRFNDQGNYWFKTDSSADPPAKLITSASTALGRYQLAADPKLTTSANESIVYPIEGGNFTDKSGKISLKFEDGDTQERLRVSAEVVDSCHQHPSTNRVLREFQLKAEAIDRDNSSVTTFAKPIDLSVAHTLREIAGFAPESVGLYWLNESDGGWERVSSQFSTDNSAISASVDHFSIFSSQGQPDIVLPAENQYFQIDQQSGSSTVAIPIDLPKGPGGFGPELNLNYASSTVDEMKKKSTMASWVGVGWNLAVPSIYIDPYAGGLNTNSAESGRQYLNMNGQIDLLVRENDLLP